MRLAFAFASLIILLGGHQERAVAADHAMARSTFQTSACAVPVPADEKIECGNLSVPENRAKPGSRLISLPVMIFRSTSATPAPDPVVYLPGGPGLSSIDGRSTGKGNPFLRDRDQIVLEGRGNLFAKPSLACPQLNTLRADGATSSQQVAAVGRCREALLASGVDLDGYTSAESAADLDDLRRLLGIAQWNLIGFSYGTRLAQTVLALYPRGVRSVVLDSVLPIDVNYDEMGATALQRALDVLFNACASDVECDTRYPDLRSQFRGLIVRADRQGIREQGRTLRGRDVVQAVAAGLQQPAVIPTIPKLISEAVSGRLDRWTPLLAVAPSRFNWGLRLSIWCAEEMPFEKPARIAAQSAAAFGLAGIDASTASAEMCAAWKVTAASPQANLPVTSDVPTLILAGEFDPVTPPAWGRRLLRTMANARFVQLPGQAHGAMFNRCGGQLTLAFLRDPRAPLDLDCIAKVQALNFAAD